MPSSTPPLIPTPAYAVSQLGTDSQICDPDDSVVLAGCEGANTGTICEYSFCESACYSDTSCSFFYYVTEGGYQGRCKKLSSCPAVRDFVNGDSIYQVWAVPSTPARIGTVNPLSPSAANALTETGSAKQSRQSRLLFNKCMNEKNFIKKGCNR